MFLNLSNDISRSIKRVAIYPWHRPSWSALDDPLTFKTMADMSGFLQRFRADCSGSTAIEYGLLAAFIAVVLVTALGTIGTKLSATFTTVASSLP
jgi:pilus assembly protein Flp/PilA